MIIYKNYDTDPQITHKDLIALEEHIKSKPLIERVQAVQLIGETGTVIDQKMTILRPTSKTWLDKRSGVVTPVSNEYKEIQAELLKYDMGRYFSFIVTSLKTDSGMTKVESYGAATNVHELLAGNMLEYGMSQFEIFRALSPDQGIRLPSLFGNIKISISGLLDVGLKMANVGIWTKLPPNPALRADFIDKSLEIARAIKQLAIVAHSESVNLDQQGFQENINIFDNSSNSYIYSSGNNV